MQTIQMHAPPAATRFLACRCTHLATRRCRSRSSRSLASPSAATQGAGRTTAGRPPRARPPPRAWARRPHAGTLFEQRPSPQLRPAAAPPAGLQLQRLRRRRPPIRGPGRAAVRGRAAGLEAPGRLLAAAAAAVDAGMPKPRELPVGLCPGPLGGLTLIRHLWAASRTEPRADQTSLQKGTARIQAI